MPYRVLTIDGGGIRGVLSAALLERLEGEVPEFLAGADLLAGTSTGAIIAMGLAAGLTPRQCRRLYEKYGPAIFAKDALRSLWNWGRIFGSAYDRTNFERVLTDIFGDMVLGDLAKRVVVPTFSLDSQRIHPKLHMRAWKPKFFHNFPGPDSDADQRVVDVALRSTAAPTFFPIYQGFIDGGVIANNPAMCALAQATDPGTGNTPLAEIAMLSLSTGAYPKFITQRYANWGLVQWAGPLIEIFTEGSVSVAEYQCSRMLGPRFHRLNPVLPSPIGLDDLTQIRTMRQLAEEQNVEPTVAWLKEYFAAPAAPPPEEAVVVERA